MHLELGSGITSATHLFIVNNHQEIITMASSKRFEGKIAFITELRVASAVRPLSPSRPKGRAWWSRTGTRRRCRRPQSR
jgi:hypothetical protein